MKVRITQYNKLQKYIPLLCWILLLKCLKHVFLQKFLGYTYIFTSILKPSEDYWLIPVDMMHIHTRRAKMTIFLIQSKYFLCCSKTFPVLQENSLLSVSGKKVKIKFSLLLVPWRPYYNLRLLDVGMPSLPIMSTTASLVFILYAINVKRNCAVFELRRTA